MKNMFQMIRDAAAMQKQVKKIQANCGIKRWNFPAAAGR